MSGISVKRVLTLLVALSVQAPGWSAEFAGGTGEPNDPYLIYTAEQMNAVGVDCSYLDKHFRLMADVDLSGVSGTDFNIIGVAPGCAFTGVFDGNGHTISNFTCTYSHKDFTGLFGYFKGSEAEIRNLRLIDPNIDAGWGFGIGSLVGYLDSGSVKNCYVEGGSIVGARLVGGLVGYNRGKIDNCHSSTRVSGNDQVGGLVGANDNGKITNSGTTGSVSEGHREVGGLVGINSSGTITNCSVMDAVSQGNDAIGGLAGRNSGSIINCLASGEAVGDERVGGLVGENSDTIIASHSSSSVTGQSEIGGLVGRNSYRAEILNCYAAGQVVGQNEVGGLVGDNSPDVSHGGVILSGIIRNCYSIAAVSGDRKVGGLVGNNTGGEVSNSFWDIETSSKITSNGGTGLMTAAMQDPNTFESAGWDFMGATRGPCDAWAKLDRGGYPILWWQLSPVPEPTTFSGGTGEPDDPYLISTVDELNSIGPVPELMGAHFKLLNDIDLTGVDFCLIASESHPFGGSFDGDGYTISNFSYSYAGMNCVGLIRCTSGATIKNLGLVGPYLDVEVGSYHGALVGRLDTGTVKNCYVETGNIFGSRDVGALVGDSSLDSTIMDCYCTGEVVGNGSRVGGMVGRNRGTVVNCYSTCTADGKDESGGLVGENYGIVVTSYSDAVVEGRNAVGGLVGRNSPGDIIDCYALGSVAGQWYVGGLVGSNSGREGRRPGTIRHCYSTTTVSSGSQTGGLAGNNNGGEVIGCFWDIETGGRTKSCGGAGKTTTEMQKAGTFLDVGWDFVDESENGTEDLWWILEGEDYPRLMWELIGANQ